MSFRKALVTGGCGFIGSNLVHKLVCNGWQVDVVDDMSNGHLEFLEGLDVRTVLADTLHLYQHQKEESRPKEKTLVIQGDFVHDNILNSIRAGKYDVIFHLAANPRVEYSVQNPIVTTETNLFKTVALFSASVGCVDRIVFSSSSAVYGDQKDLPTPEGASKNPNSPYGLQKLQCEQYACLLYTSDAADE